MKIHGIDDSGKVTEYDHSPVSEEKELEDYIESNPGIIEKDMPMHISNVAFLDLDSNKGTRIGYKINKDGKKVRINKKSGKEI